MAENTTSGRTAVYEGMFIFDANRFARDQESLPNDIASYIEEAGGKLEVSRLWEERRLAYPINGQRKGAYWITYFQLPTAKVGEITRKCELREGILRQLFVRLPEALVDPIISHAKGETIVDEPEDVAEEAAEEVATEEGKEVAATEEGKEVAAEETKAN